MKKICVFTGAASGNSPLYRERAVQLGKMISERGFGLVYGGGSRGLMGSVTDGVIKNGGPVVGVIPKFLEKVEIAHSGITDLRIVETMHERKALMYDLSDAFVIMPGGLGTLDEAMEIITWRQLGVHNKPVIIANIDRYWDPLLSLFQNIIDKGFMHHGKRGHFEVAETLDCIFEKI